MPRLYPTAVTPTLRRGIQEIKNGVGETRRKVKDADMTGKQDNIKEEGNTVAKSDKENLDEEEEIKSDGSQTPTESESSGGEMESETLTNREANDETKDTKTTVEKNRMSPAVVKEGTKDEATGSSNGVVEDNSMQAYRRNDQDKETTQVALQENTCRKRRKLAKPRRYVDFVAEQPKVELLETKEPKVETAEEPKIESVLVDLISRVARNQEEAKQAQDGNEEAPLNSGIQLQGQNKEQHDDLDSGQEEGEQSFLPGSNNAQEELTRNPRYGNRTFSTFAPEEQDRLREEASRIHDGACFANYADFLRCFEAYKIVGSYPYRIASSELLRDGLNNLDLRYKYRYVVFHCAHYGNPRKRGEGKRPNQSYLPSGCKAKFRMNVDPANGRIKISSFEGTHCNHEQGEEDYLRVISKKRRIDSGNMQNLALQSFAFMGLAELLTEEPRLLMLRNRPIKAKIRSGKLSKRENVSGTPKNSRPKKSPKGGKEEAAEMPTDNDVSMPGPSGINSNSIRRNSGSMSPENASPFQQVLTPATSSLSLQTNESTAAVQSTISPLIQHMMIMGMGIGRRQERIQFIAANVYFLAAGQFLPQPLHYDLLYSMCSGNFCISGWSDDQLSNVLKVFLQPPEVMLSDHLPPDISLNDVKEIRPEVIQRAIAVIRDEKLKRIEEILGEIIQYVMTALFQPDFVTVLEKFEKFGNDLINMNVDKIKLQPKSD